MKRIGIKENRKNRKLMTIRIKNMLKRRVKLAYLKTLPYDVAVLEINAITLDVIMEFTKRNNIRLNVKPKHLFQVIDNLK